MADGVDPTPDLLLDLEGGERIVINLDGGDSVEAEVVDPRHPNLGGRKGNGQVSTFVSVDGEDRVLTAYHEDKNHERREDLTKFQIPSIYAPEWQAVESIEFLGDG